MNSYLNLLITINIHDFILITHVYIVEGDTFFIAKNIVYFRDSQLAEKPRFSEYMLMGDSINSRKMENIFLSYSFGIIYLVKKNRLSYST